MSEIRQTWGGGEGGACPKSLKTPDLEYMEVSLF